MTAEAQQSATSATTVDSVTFVSAGARCQGELHRPTAVAQPPVVVMAHGFAAERAFVLPRVAARFAAAGLAVLLFDYRGFGESEGVPRHLVQPGRHLADWQAAMQFVRDRSDLDATRVALWGTSLSGGHVIRLAATDPDVSAIVAQCPFVDPLTTMRWVGYRHVWRWATFGVLDTCRHWLGRTPLLVPVFGPPGSRALLPTREAEQMYPQMIPAGSTWQNQCPARSILSLPFYRPRSYARRVRCPALIFVAADDSLIYESSVLKTAAAMPNAEVVPVTGGHFGVYYGTEFERVVSVQTEFLKRTLGAV